MAILDPVIDANRERMKEVDVIVTKLCRKEGNEILQTTYSVHVAEKECNKAKPNDDISPWKIFPKSNSSSCRITNVLIRTFDIYSGTIGGTH